MLQQGSNQWTLCSLGTITSHCRYAVLSIISLLLVVTAGSLPAVAQQSHVITFSEAASGGAVFDTIENRGNCPVTFPPDTTGELSGIIKVDCTHSDNPGHNIVVVRLFSRMLLVDPWVISRVEINRPGGGGDGNIRLPALGTRNLWTELRMVVQGGESSQLTVVLAADPGLVEKAVCPAPPHPLTIACFSNQDCRSGTSCHSCGACMTSTREPGMPRILTVGEMRDAGWGSTLKIIWEGGSRNNALLRCPTSFDNGRTAAESVATVLSCSKRLSGAQASFDMFKDYQLVGRWTVDSVTVTPFQTGSSSSVNSNLTLPAPGSTSVYTRVRLNAAAHQQARAAISIRITPNNPPPLPDCRRPFGFPRFLSAAQTRIARRAAVLRACAAWHAETDACQSNSARSERRSCELFEWRPAAVLAIAVLEITDIPN